MEEVQLQSTVENNMREFKVDTHLGWISEVQIQHEPSSSPCHKKS
jgi:hypothetical protein